MIYIGLSNQIGKIKSEHKLNPMITTTSLMLGDDEMVINDHSIVSVDAADAIKVQVENEPKGIGFTYLVNEMDYHEDEKGSYWTVGAELTAGEGLFNDGIGYSTFRINDSHIIQFLEGNRYQITVTVLGGNPSEPEQIGYYVYDINGSYNSREVETSLMSNDEETLLSEHSDTSVEQSDGISVRAIDYFEAAQFLFEINPMILHQDEQGTSWIVDESVVIASGNSPIRGVGYYPFDNIISFNFGKRYRVKVTLYTFQLDELETIEYFINGATDTDVE